jgi:hypothetical protein
MEQFFRMGKHILKIQEAKSQNKMEMDIKVGRFFGMALLGQFLVLHLRKKNQIFQKIRFKTDYKTHYF